MFVDEVATRHLQRKHQMIRNSIPVAGSKQFCINFDCLCMTLHDSCLDLLPPVWGFSSFFIYDSLLSVCVISSTLCVPLPTHESTRLPRCGRGNSCAPPGSGRCFQRSREHDGEITIVGITLELGRSEPKVGWSYWVLMLLLHENPENI